jgi:hypothetical protein
MKTHRWLAHLASVLSCVLVLASAGTAGAALRRIDFRPPNLHVNVGQMDLVAFTSYPSLWATKCATRSRRCQTRRRFPVYAVWLVDRRAIPGSSRDAFHQLAVLPLSLTQLAESLST